MPQVSVLADQSIIARAIETIPYIFCLFAFGNCFTRISTYLTLHIFLNVLNVCVFVRVNTYAHTCTVQVHVNELGWAMWCFMSARFVVWPCNKQKTDANESNLNSSIHSLLFYKSVRTSVCSPVHTHIPTTNKIRLDGLAVAVQYYSCMYHLCQYSYPERDASVCMYDENINFWISTLLLPPTKFYWCWSIIIKFVRHIFCHFNMASLTRVIWLK